MTLAAVYLLLALNICHWIGDYTHASTSWMLSAKRIGKPLLPIFVHALIHTLLMGIVIMAYTMDAYLTNNLMFIQLFSHFLIDVLKGKMNVWYPNVSQPQNKSHWYIFGLDQLLHQIVIIIMVFIILK